MTPLCTLHKSGSDVLVQSFAVLVYRPSFLGYHPVCYNVVKQPPDQTTKYDQPPVAHPGNDSVEIRYRLRSEILNNRSGTFTPQDCTLHCWLAFITTVGDSGEDESGLRRKVCEQITYDNTCNICTANATIKFAAIAKKTAQAANINFNAAVAQTPGDTFAPVWVHSYTAMYTGSGNLAKRNIHHCCEYFASVWGSPYTLLFYESERIKQSGKVVIINTGCLKNTRHNFRSLPSKETLRGHSDSSFRGEGYIQCCVGVRLCDMYSNQELAEIHFMYGKVDGNAALARRLYQERYPQRQCPDRKTCVRLHYRLCEYGKFNSPGLGRGRPRSTTPEVQEEILEAVNMTASISTRRAALQVNVPHTTVWRLLKEYQLYPYHLQRVQALLPADYPARVRFCQWF
ncbi:hypothetical protein ANN_22635 [Periplaneta americana]|uniref:DUF4817 domain-containing protein n=1 Tax=Periplaneta americana TaxID=6978 RepID=A0ABQ8S8P0_PERAM|nr:hypothetical protein ANN_22635 [Periplaneta americana]